MAVFVARSGNTFRISGTTLPAKILTSEKNIRVTRIDLTATSANATLVLSDGFKKIDLYNATSNTSVSRDYDSGDTAAYFPNGITVSTLVNGVATITVSRKAGA